jgi:hypothetical protein
MVEHVDRVAPGRLAALQDAVVDRSTLVGSFVFAKYFFDIF